MATWGGHCRKFSDLLILIYSTGFRYVKPSFIIPRYFSIIITVHLSNGYGRTRMSVELVESLAISGQHASETLRKLSSSSLQNCRTVSHFEWIRSIRTTLPRTRTEPVMMNYVQYTSLLLSPCSALLQLQSGYQKLTSINISLLSNSLIFVPLAFLFSANFR